MGENKFKFLLRVESNNISSFEEKLVYFSKPRLVGLYDLDYDEITPSKKVKYFRDLKSSDYPVVLNVEPDKYHFLKRSTETRLLHALLPTMNFGTEEDQREPDIKFDVEQTAVYSRKGILKDIMGFCYAKSSFTVLVSRHKGNIFMIKKIPKSEELADNKSGHTHYGRLSQLVFAEKLDGPIHSEQPIDENIAQVAVYCSILKKFAITYAGEMPGIISEESLDIDNINALNGQQFVLAKQMMNSLKSDESKLLNYWSQAYLANVTDIYFAYKDRNGIVRNPIEHVKRDDIPKKCSWKPGVCTGFLYEFLEQIQRVMSDVDSLETVYEFYFKSKDKTVHYKIHKENSKQAFIPQKYCRFIMESSSQ